MVRGSLVSFGCIVTRLPPCLGLSSVSRVSQARLKSRAATKALGDIIRKVQGHEQELLTLVSIGLSPLLG